MIQDSSAASNLNAIFVRPIEYSLVSGLSAVVLSRGADVHKDWISFFIFCFRPTLAILTLAIPVLLTNSELMHASLRFLQFLKFALGLHYSIRSIIQAFFFAVTRSIH
jgi:hypothetical protein